MITTNTTRGQLSAIGLDMGGRAVKAVQLVGGETSWRVHRAAVFPRPSIERRAPREGHEQADGGAKPDATDEKSQRGRRRAIDTRDVAAVCGVLGRLGFSGRRVALTVPHDGLEQALIETPPAKSGAPIAKLAHAELARIRRAQPADVQSACWTVGRREQQRGSGGKEEVLAVGCSTRDARALAHAFDEAGFELVALDAACCAAARAACVLAGAGSGVRLVADMGWSACRIIAVDHGTTVYQRSLGDLGLLRLHERCAAEFGFRGPSLERVLSAGADAGADVCAHGRLAEAADYLGSTFFEPIQREIQASIGFIESGLGCSSERAVLLIGGGASVPSVRKLVEQASGEAPSLPCSAGDEGSPSVGPVSLQAAGLALRFDGRDAA